MEYFFASDPILSYFKLFPCILKLLSFKYKRMSWFLSIFYIIILAKLKLKSLSVQSLKKKQFKNLMLQNKYLSDFKGDVYSCGLISINTLIALSIQNESWIKVSRKSSKQEKNCSAVDLQWKIKVPPVNAKCSIDDNHYYMQCLCVSDVPEDFTLFVTEDKLLNLTKLGNEESDYCDMLNYAIIEYIEVQNVPLIAKSAVVACISSCHDIMPEEYEHMLEYYFRKPRLLKAGDVFQVNLKKFIKCSKSSGLGIEYVHFKVIQLSGEPSINDLYYVVKNYSSLYLNPPVHGYMPSVKTRYVEFDHLDFGQVVSYCPEGLHKQYVYLQKMFQPFLTMTNLKVNPIFLLSGPKGNGKNTTIRAVAAFFGLHLIEMDCFDFYGLNPSLVYGKFQQVFAKARRIVPCVVYLQNVDLLGREKSGNVNPRLVDIFVTQLEELWCRKPFSYPVFIVGSTHLTPEVIVAGIARLFVETVTFEVFKSEDSFRALKWLVTSHGMSCSAKVLKKVVEKCKGYVHNDFKLLVKHAIGARLEDVDLINCNNRELSLPHFETAIEIMDVAYSDSIGAARVPTVHWEDIGGLSNLKEEIMVTLNLPLKYPEMFAAGLKRSGIMFYGPPGTGKTLLAKAIATECNYNFLSVKGPELMNMYVGESEKNVREVFSRARDAAPCIIFFDELDSLAPCRGKSGDSGGVTDRVVSQLLAEMDGLDENRNVFVLGATNRPDLVDPALLRPGRFDKMFHVGICSDNESKCSVLKALTRKFILSEDVDLEQVAKDLPEDVSGADLYSVSSNAWFSAARKAVDAVEKGSPITLPLVVNANDFRSAINEFVPSLSDEEINYYKTFNIFRANSPSFF